MVKFSALPRELGNICKIISKINKTEKIAPKHIKKYICWPNLFKYRTGL